MSQQQQKLHTSLRWRRNLTFTESVVDRILYRFTMSYFIWSVLPKKRLVIRRTTKRNLKMRYEGEDWIQLVQDRLVTGFCRNANETSDVTKGTNFLISQKLSSSTEGFCSWETVWQIGRSYIIHILERFLTFTFIILFIRGESNVFVRCRTVICLLLTKENSRSSLLFYK